jgi:rod shape-determining protein MreD
VAEPLRESRLAWRAGFVAFFAALMWLRLLPLGDARAADWPAPDLMLALVAAWVLRRPDHLPALLIGLVVLAEDLLLHRPPGLWAACAVLMAEFLRSRAALSRELPFPAEWFLVAVVVATTMLVHRVALGLTLTPMPPLGPAAVQLAGTILAYPAVVAVLHGAFGLRKPAAGEVDAMGRRL